MTPNPKNIGAAPEEYPIRALVRGDNWGSMDRRLAGTVRQWKAFGLSYWTPCDLEGCDCHGKMEWACYLDSLLFDPTPEQIAEERAKAGLPPPDAVGVPEPQAKGPSEVTQPGEGVDLEAALEEMGAVIEDIIVSDCHSTRSRAQDAAGGIMDLVRNLITRATLRRESK